MIPAIPDTLSKLILAIGIFLIGYSFFATQSEYKEYSTNFEKNKSQIDSLSDKQEINEYKLKILNEKAKDLSSQYGVKNPLKIKDSLVIFEEILTGSKNDIRVNGELKRLWEDYKNADFYFKHDLKKFNRLNSSLKELNNDHNNDTELYNLFLILGILCGFLGFLTLSIEEIKKERIFEYENVLFCQSCAKKFYSPVQRAKYNDGEINKLYCCECFSNDKFTDETLTADIIYKRCLSHFKKTTKLSRFLLKVKVNKLHRWFNSPY